MCYILYSNFAFLLQKRVRMYVQFLIFGGRKLITCCHNKVATSIYGSRKKKYLEVEVYKVHEIVEDGK